MNRALIIAAAFFTSSAWACDQPPKTEAFLQFDANQDGYISAQEADQNTQLIIDFVNLDVNADTKLDIAEFAVFEHGA